MQRRGVSDHLGLVCKAAISCWQYNGLAAAMLMLLGKVQQFIIKSPLQAQILKYMTFTTTVSLSLMTTVYTLHACPTPQGGWQNKVLARLALETTAYSPIEYLRYVRAPVLFMSASQDTLCPTDVIRQAAAQLGAQAKHLEYDVTHFGLYLGAIWEDAIKKVVAFMREHTANPAARQAQA